MKLPALFGYGFRPLFLAALLAAALLIPWWAASLAWSVPLGTAWPASLWHGHEMLFGFIAAAIAGFLLTAVPSWTGERGFAGWPLVLLTVLWLLGRASVASSLFWPPWFVAGLDLLFLPALVALVLPPLVRARNRNTPLLAVLAAFWAADVAFYWGSLHGDWALARHALLVGIDIVLLLVTVIGGRIIPAFTRSGFQQRGITPAPVRAWTGMTALSVVAMIAVVLVDLFSPAGAAAALVALVAAALQTIRLSQWSGWRTLRMPIVWVLHLSYLWLPVGLALKALTLLRVPFGTFYLHGLTIGAAASMIVAVVTRASLGHTGRPLVITRPTAIAYGLLSAAAATRVLGPMYLPLSYPQVIVLAAALWTAAFVLLLWVYAPILCSARADGKAG